MKLRKCLSLTLFSALVVGGLPSAHAKSIDASGAMYVEPSTIVVKEGDGDDAPHQVVFTVYLGYADIARPQTVPYEIIPGTAMPGEDYEPVPAGSLVFAEGERSKTVVVNLIGDRTPECGEHFFLRLYREGVGVDTIATIADDDRDAIDGGVALSCPSQDPADGGTATWLPIPPDAAPGTTTPLPHPFDGGMAQTDPGLGCLDSGAARPNTGPDAVDPGGAQTGAQPSAGGSSGCSISASARTPWSFAALGLLLLTFRRRRRLTR